MSEIEQDELQRRIAETLASVAGLSEDDAAQVLEFRAQRAQLHGVALHRLSLAQARGTLAKALGEGAEAEVLTSLEDLVTTIAQAPPPQGLHLGPAARITDPSRPDFDPELALDTARLLDRHRENAVTILGLIARAATHGDDALLARLETLLEHDLEALTELENR